MTRRKAMQWGAFSAGISFVIAAAAAWAVVEGRAPGRDFQTVPIGVSEQVPVASVRTDEPSGDNLRMTNDVRVYQKVKDAVVNIISSHKVQARVSSGDPFQDIFGGGRIVEAQATSLGSGFVIHPSGYIITNEHVVDQGTDHECVFSDGTKLKADVIATDDEHDLAVLKVSPPKDKPLAAIELGSSEDLMIGEPVYAIGNPFGYAGSMTRGIVSALNRSIDADPKKSYKGLIQTDASINPGNSGGPLLNAYGQVVGINTAIRQGAEGIGFAIGVSSMRDLLPAFLNPEAMSKAQIGFTLAEKRQEEPPARVVARVIVEKVQPGSMADKAGLKNGDALVGVGKTRVTTVIDALVALASAKEGDTLDLHVLRGDAGEQATKEVAINVTKAPPTEIEQLLLSKMGIKAQTVTPKLIAQYSLPVNNGVFIEAVKANSPAAACGMRPGDVLFQVGRYRVPSVEDLAGLLKKIDSHADATVGIIRGDSIGQGKLTLD